MATNTNYKDFEDDVIKELKRQLRPSVSDEIDGFFLSFRGAGIVAHHAPLSPLIKRSNLNEEMYRSFLEENYRAKFDECNGNTDKISELKTTALTRLLERFRGQVSQ